MPRVKIEFSDDVSKRLMKYAERAPHILENVLLKISSEMKKDVDSAIQKTFHERTGKMRKQLRYIKRSRGIYKLASFNLANIFERGAEIFPKEADFLQFQINGKWVRTNWVTIPAKPTFYPTVRKFVSANKVNLNAEKVIDKEVRKLGLFG